jgi:adenylate cyclase
MLTPPHILDARILIVDDQVANVRLLEQMLGGAGYTALTSTMDPHEACALHRANPYDLILLDLQMPGMDGFQVIEQLKEIEQNGYLPVLVITAQPGHKLRALQAGAKDFVSKPFDLAEVQMRVRNMLEVRLLHVQSKNDALELARTLRDVEANREVIRSQGDELRNLYDQVVIEQKLADRLMLNELPDTISVRPDEEVRPLVPAFLEHRRVDVVALTAALGARDFTAISGLGHRLKETGRAYGFDGVTEIGSALERAAHHQDAGTIETRIGHLSGYLHRVKVVE